MNEKVYEELKYKIITVHLPVAQSVECPLRGTGGHWVDPGPRHTKVIKMVLAAPRLALRITLQS